MKIHDDHFYHGSALIQIAEHPLFTAINSMQIGSVTLRSSYKINQQIGIYLKYSVVPVTRYGVDEYSFTFHFENINELAEIYKQVEKLFLIFVCVQDREICCINHGELVEMIAKRMVEKKEVENQYTVLVSVQSGKSLKVYVNYPGQKGYRLGHPLIVPRNNFPKILFM
ncbi:MAG: hypothetical protein R2757_21875 [Draconibacterium sp.]